ncbi:MAG: type II secretion system minor pseudopilin GspI [Gammaproteobacteria bacterium]|nr:type II secretion system minor pseudopilin GspI [Gammaproteobacteria bacterium]
MSKIKKLNGFTLLEVMVALAVLALTTTAVFTGIRTYAQNLSYVKQRTLASWIAANEMTRLRIERQWPKIGRLKNDVEYAGVEWDVVMDVSATDVDALRRIDVAVSLIGETGRDSQAVLTTAGFIGKPNDKQLPVKTWVRSQD